MAKKEYDSFVTALINLKGMVSNLKLLSHVIAFENNSQLVYMSPMNDMHDCFAIIKDPTLIAASEKFQWHILNTTEAVSFNKALKKTKTVSELKDDKTISFSTEGYDETLSLLPIDDYNSITKTYQKLFKDVDLTKECLRAIYGNSHNWVSLNSDDMEKLKNNALIVVSTEYGDNIYISKTLFGNIKKTHLIQYTVIQLNESDMVMLFRQCEDGYDIYHVFRFLRSV